MEKLTEYDEYGEEHGNVKYKLRHFNKFKVLLIATVIFLLLSIIFITLFAVEKAKDCEPENLRVFKHFAAPRRVFMLHWVRFECFLFSLFIEVGCCIRDLSNVKYKSIQLKA